MFLYVDTLELYNYGKKTNYQKPELHFPYHHHKKVLNDKHVKTYSYTKLPRLGCSCHNGGCIQPIMQLLYSYHIVSQRFIAAPIAASIL